VIAIIAMLAALVVPAVFSAIASTRNAKTKAEVDMLHMALMNYKNEYGSFPPANMKNLWDSTSSPNQVNKSHPAYKHLAKIFPRLSELTTAAGPYDEISQLSPAQALVFWLRGFYDNPEYPLTNGGTPGTRKKLFEFDEMRFYACSTYLFDGTPQTFASRGSSGAAGMSADNPVYFTGHPSCGLPYVYFDTRCYDNAPASDIAYAATNAAGDSSIASTYINSLPVANGTWAQQHMAGDTFQIIAAGKDGLYGNSVINQAAYPTTTAYTLTWLGNARTYVPVTDPVNGKGHADNLTNFADRQLADAIESLKSK